ncbi:MAG: Ig-like domain-containing protein, partial [Planctomycetota bacterium]
VTGLGASNTTTATSANGGTVVLDTVNRTVTYTPPADFVGTDTFTYRVTDDGLTNGQPDPKSAIGTVTVTISAVNDAPVPGPDSQSTDEDVPLVFAAVTLIGNDLPGPATATDEVGQFLTVVAVSSTSVAGGTVSLTSGTVSYTPPQDFFGTDTFTYTVRDNGSPVASATGTVTVTVRPVNDPPVPVSDTRVTPEDTGHVFSAASLTLNDAAGPDNENTQLLTVTGVSAVSTNQGTVSLISGVITYTPPADFNGLDIFTYTVADNGSPSRTATGTVTMNVTAVNDAPSAGSDSRTTAEDTALTISAATLLNNDIRGPVNESGQTLTVQSVSAVSAQGGGVTLNTITNEIVYTPKADFNGNDTFTYTIVDNGLTDGLPDPKNATATVTVTVTPVNDEPIAIADFQATSEDRVLTIDTSILLANDLPGPSQTGIDQELMQSLVVTGISQTSANGGTITLVGTTVTYLPPANFFGIDTFTYQIQDNGTTNGLPDAKSAMGTITVNVSAVNDPPIMAASTSVTIEDQPLAIDSFNLTLNDRGGPGLETSEQLTVIGVVGFSAQGGTLVLGAGGTVTYTPPLNFNGVDTFTYTVRDNGLTNGASDPQTAMGTHSVTVTSANDPPSAVNDAFAANEDAVLQVQGRGVLGNDFDIDLPANTLTVSNAGQLQSDQGAVVTLNANGTFTYDPTAAANIQALRDGEPLVDRFRYRAFDGTVQSNEATVNITVVGVNDAPQAVDDTFSVTQGSQLTVGIAGSILLNDTDAEEPEDPANPFIGSLTAVRISGPSNGTLNLNSNGTFTYTPAPNFNGADTFVYRASDGAANSNAATVTINVGAVNSPPNAGPDSYSTANATTLSVNAALGVLRNDTDEQPATLTARRETGPANGTLVLNANGSFAYTPNSGFTGTDRFTYRAIDNGGLQSAPATVSITVASAAAFQNPTNPRDVNADGVVSPIDALLLINYLNEFGSHELTEALPGIPFPDTNGDNFISPADVLVVVNHLNSVGNSEGEGLVQATTLEFVGQKLFPGFAIQPAVGGSTQLPLKSVGTEQLAAEDDAVSGEDFFAELGRHDFARSQQAMSLSARASLAAKANELESALDCLFGANDFED